MKRAILISMVFVVSGCKAADLNGEKSAVPVSPEENRRVPVLPVISSKKLHANQTLVSGTVFRGTGVQRAGVAGVTVQIFSDGEVTAETVTQAGGAFEWRGLLAPGKRKISVELGGVRNEVSFDGSVQLNEKLDVEF